MLCTYVDDNLISCILFLFYFVVKPHEARCGAEVFYFVVKPHKAQMLWC